MEEPVEPPAGGLAGIEAVAAALGLTADELRELASRGELPEGLHAGQLLVEGVQPPSMPERLRAGTTRSRARMAQSIALEHFFERLFKPVVPNRSI